MARIKKGKAKDRLDKYYRMAKEQGLRARSAFKLVQLNRKFAFLQKARTLLDLGAAPGGWLQIAQKTMTIASTIVGVDLMPIKPIHGVKTIVGDFLSESVRRNIKSTLGNRKADVVLHDGAPNVSGAWDKDAYVQNVLVLTACKLACEFLAKGGTFVTKIFRSGDYPKLMFVLKELFEKAHATKPESSRFTSAEIFVVCLGFKAPRKVDPKFFNPKEVFADLVPDKPMKKEQALTELSRDFEKKKKKAVGYDVPGLLLFKSIPISDFVASESPEMVVRDYNEITFAQDGSEERFRTSAHTTPVVLEACKDLKSIGLWTAKKLLQWQSKLRREDATRAALERGARPDTEEIEIGSDPESEDADKDIATLEGELASIQKSQERAIKKARKKVIAKKLKQAVFGYNRDENPDIGTAGEPGILDIAGGDVDLDEKLKQVTEEDYDAHYDVRKYDPLGGLGDIHRSKQLGEDNAGIDPFGDEADSDDEGGLLDGEEAPEAPDNEEQEERDFYSRMESIVRRRPGGKRKRSDVEEGLDGTGAEVPGEHLEDDDDADDGKDTFDLGPDGEDLAVSSSSSSDSESGSEDGSRKDRRRRRRDLALERKDNKVAPSGFETLPDSMRDPMSRAKIHAMATRMLDKRDKRELLEAAVNRWCFNDDDLPEWFRKDERKHCFRILPVTREEVEQQKARFRALNALPPKKVMQAIQRKRLKAKRILSRLVEKDKNNPTKNKKELPSVRKLMHSDKLDTRKLKKKEKKTDPKLRGERFREWERKKKDGLLRGRGGKKLRK
jgi:AdoMet-dependent rRNA methyltransferase SPB1